MKPSLSCGFRGQESQVKRGGGEAAAQSSCHQRGGSPGKEGPCPQARCPAVATRPQGPGVGRWCPQPSSGVAPAPCLSTGVLSGSSPSPAPPRVRWRKGGQAGVKVEQGGQGGAVGGPARRGEGQGRSPSAGQSSWPLCSFLLGALDLPRGWPGADPSSGTSGVTLPPSCRALGQAAVCRWGGQRTSGRGPSTCRPCRPELRDGLPSLVTRAAPGP